MRKISASFLILLQVCFACGDLSGISTDSSTVQNEILNVHNFFRRAVSPTARNMLNMTWSAEVAESAQKWIDLCEMKHGPSSSRMIGNYECGENLFQSEKPVSWSQIIGAWHREVKNYQYPIGSKNGEPIGHYTQVVWYSSYEVGCAAAKCPNSMYFYGCQYYRAGNYRGEAPYVAGPSCGDCPDNCDDKLCTNPCPYVDKYINCPALEKEAGCDNALVNVWCPSQCKCHNQIISKGRK